MKTIPFPSDNEHALYYEQYLKEADPSKNVLNELKLSSKNIIEQVKKLNDEKLHYAYAPGKWTIKDIIQHLTDTERVFVYRAMRIARLDKTPLPFFDEDQFALAANANKKNIRKIIKEFATTRTATLAFFDSLHAKDLKKIGIASNFNLSVRACPWIILTHEMHHWKVIQERYL